MFLPLVQNETLKILRRRRFAVVVGILLAIIALVTYSQYQRLKDQRNRNWRAEIQQRIANYQNVLRRERSNNQAWTKSLRAEMKRLQFYLDHDIEPDKPTAPIFVRGFANASGWLLPLLVAMFGADIVSAEISEGTDKLLLTRPVRRSKILLSKLVTLWMFATLTLLCGALIAFAISSLALPARGWNAPMFTGFQVNGGALNVGEIRQLPLWKDALIAYGLQWYALLCVASIALMLSVLFRSSAAAIGTMLASLIGGTILTRISPDWTTGKYLFVSALPLADYYSGLPPPYEGMTMTFNMLLLLGWAAGCIAISFAIFTRRDVFG